jgi:hypothetical protein
MASKDVARFFGSIRFVLPLILIFFIAAGSAIACPKHTSKAGHRTKSLNTRTVSYMTPVVITYGGRCADNGTRRVKYVSTRDNGYYEGGTRYVAVRRSVPRTRYVAVRGDVDYVPARRVRYVVRDDDDDFAPRYVAVGRNPAYVAVRNYAPRPKLVEVRHFDDGYARPTYVNVQRVPVVDDYFDRVDRKKTVAVSYVRNGCARVVTCGNRLDDVETTSMRRVVYRDDVGYSAPVRHEVVKSDFIDGTEAVIYSSPIHDDSAYVDHLDDQVMDTADVAYTAPAELSYMTPMANREVAYVATRNAVNQCTPFEPTEPCSGAIARTVSYGDAAYVDVDHDDQAFFDNDDVTFVAAENIEDACLSPVSYYESPPVVKSRAVSYVLSRNVSYVADGGDYVEPDVSYVADDQAECLQPVSVQTCDGADFETVSYVPANGVDYVDTADTAYCPTSVSNFDDSELFVDAGHHSMMVDVDSVDALNNGFAYNDGFDADVNAVEEMDVDDVHEDAYMDDHVSELHEIDDSI